MCELITEQIPSRSSLSIIPLLHLSKKPLASNKYIRALWMLIHNLILLGTSLRTLHLQIQSTKFISEQRRVDSMDICSFTFAKTTSVTLH